MGKSFRYLNSVSDHTIYSEVSVITIEHIRISNKTIHFVLQISPNCGKGAGLELHLGLIARSYLLTCQNRLFCTYAVKYTINIESINFNYEKIVDNGGFTTQLRRDKILEK